MATNEATREALAAITTELISNDTARLNAVVNRHFDPKAVYCGHGLEIHGTQNLKHAAWIWHGLNAAGPSTVSVDDVSIAKDARTAHIRAKRLIRPRLFSLVGIEVPVSTKLVFRSHESDSGDSILIERLEEDWVVETIVKLIPGAAAAHNILFRPLWTCLFLALSNFLFAMYARLSVMLGSGSSFSKVGNPSHSVVQAGRAHGQAAASYLMEMIMTMTYPPLALFEATMQSAVLLMSRFLKVSLPYPYVYDAHCHAPGHISQGKKPALEHEWECQKTAAPRVSDRPKANHRAPLTDDMGSRKKQKQSPRSSKKEDDAAKPVAGSPQTPIKDKKSKSDERIKASKENISTTEHDAKKERGPASPGVPERLSNQGKALSSRPSPVNPDHDDADSIGGQSETATPKRRSRKSSSKKHRYKQSEVVEGDAVQGIIPSDKRTTIETGTDTSSESIKSAISVTPGKSTSRAVGPSSSTAPPADSASTEREDVFASSKVPQKKSGTHKKKKRNNKRSEGAGA